MPDPQRRVLPPLSPEPAEQALQQARAAGAAQARVSLSRSRAVEVKVRAGKIETLQEATRVSLDLALFVDGRYSAHRTSDLRSAALSSFVREAVAATRHLGPDPARGLPPAERCRGYAPEALDLADPAVLSLSPEERRRRALELEALGRQAAGARCLSVTASFEDASEQRHLLLSSGAALYEESTAAWWGLQVSVKGDDERRPEDGSWAGACHLADLPSASGLAEDAAQRALAQLGAEQPKTSRGTVVVESRAAGTLLDYLIRALDGRSVQQDRSFLTGRQDQPVGSAALDLREAPLRCRGLASRHFDAEGMAAQPFALFEEGVLRNLYLDSTYARKLGRTPTTGSSSNLVLRPGSKSLADLIKAAGDGVLLQAFLGGNANGTTGDFSLGFRGQRIVGGEVAGPVAGATSPATY